MKKIKIIDLLNMRARNEEMPRKIKHQYYDYSWNDFAEDYQKGDGEMLFGNMKLVYHLNDEVEIIEEDKQIEKIDLSEVDKNGFCVISIKDEMIQNKLNEVIDALNKLNKDN